MNSRLRARGAFLALSFVLLVSGCGTKKADEGAGEVKVVPRPAPVRSDAGSTPSRPRSCFEGDDCRAGQSCTGTCGVHQLGDSSCACEDESITCTSCVLNPAFKGMLQDATAFCPESVAVGQSCTTKGATCIAYDSAADLREPCLCWRGKTGLEWDCDENYPTVTTPGFFKDLAPAMGPSPGGGNGGGPNPNPFGNPNRDAAAPTPPAGQDASGP